MPFRVACVCVCAFSIELLIGRKLDIPCQEHEVQILQVAHYVGMLGALEGC